MTATEEIPATTTAPAKVDDIIKALSGLESNIDSLNEKIADMKNQLNQKALKEIDKLREQVTEMATKEAESIIAQSREKAKSESQKIATEGGENLKNVQKKIENLKNVQKKIGDKFDEAVDHVVSTVLKA